MLLWLILGAVVIGGGYVAYRVGKARGATQELPPAPRPSGTIALGASATAPAGTAGLLERTIADVRVDDVIQRAGRDWLVEGVVRYEEDGHVWNGARIVDGTDESWVVIGLDRGAGMNVRVLRPASGVELSGYPPESLAVGDVRYKLAKRGTATASFQGEIGAHVPAKGVAAGGSLRCRWWRYQAPGEKCLVVEQWGDAYRALAGESINPDELELLAGS